MNGLMMDFPLTLVHLLERAGELHRSQEIVSRLPDESIAPRRAGEVYRRVRELVHAPVDLARTTWGEVYRRVHKLANALSRLGVNPGERVATLGWNHARHLEAYFGVPVMGGVLHTLNPRLHPSDLAYIVNHAQDQVLLVDEVLLPVLERFRAEIRPRHVVVWAHGRAVPEGMLDYEQLIADELPS